MSQPATALQDTSSPAYFESTFKVSAAEAASLSAQARAADSTRGGGLTTQAPARFPVAAPPGVAVAPTPPAAPTLTARQAYDQLQADRMAGKVSTGEYRQREQQLAEQIANGQGDRLPESVPAVETDPLAAEFAPSQAPSDFVFPAPPDGHSDETIALDNAIKEAFHRDGSLIPKQMNLAASLLQTDMPKLESMTKEAVIEWQEDGLLRMWPSDAEFAENLAIWRDVQRAWQQSREPLVREYARAAMYINPVAVNAIVAATRLRNARR